MPLRLGQLLTFTFVVISLVFFRSATVGQALDVTRSMFSLHGGFFNYVPWSALDRVEHLMGLSWMGLGCLILLRGPTSFELQKTFRPSWAMVWQCVAMASIACIYVNGVVSRSFVYRDF